MYRFTLRLTLPWLRPPPHPTGTYGRQWRRSRRRTNMMHCLHVATLYADTPSWRVKSSQNLNEGLGWSHHRKPQGWLSGHHQLVAGRSSSLQFQRPLPPAHILSNCTTCQLRTIESPPHRADQRSSGPRPLREPGHRVPHQDEHWILGIISEGGTARGRGALKEEWWQGDIHIAWCRLRGPPEHLTDLWPDGAVNIPLVCAHTGTKMMESLGAPGPSGTDGGCAWHQYPDGGNTVTTQRSRDTWRENVRPGGPHQGAPAFFPR